MHVYVYTSRCHIQLRVGAFVNLRFSSCRPHPRAPSTAAFSPVLVSLNIWGYIFFLYIFFSIHFVCGSTYTSGFLLVLVFYFGVYVCRYLKNCAWYNYSILSTSSLVGWLVGLFRAAPMAYKSSQAGGWIGAVATSLCHSHSHSQARSEPHLQSTPQLLATLDP